MYKNYTKHGLTILLFVASNALFAQNVAINLSGNTGNKSAIVDLSDPSNANLGFLMTNVNLASVTDQLTIPSPATGMIVWNTNTALPFGIGFYYWTGPSGNPVNNWVYINNSGTSSSGTVTSIGPAADGALVNTGGSGLYFSSNPITGAGTIGIAITGVTAGTYGSTSVVPQITVNAEGQITSETDQAITPTSIGMADLTAGTGITAFTYNGSSAQTVTLANTTVTAGTYGDAADVPTYTVNAQGQLTAAANVPISASGIGAVTSVTGNAPIVITGSATAPDVNIQDPGNTPGGVLYSMGTGNSAVYTSSGAVGTILYNDVANTPSWLTPGTAGQILTIVGGLPVWQNALTGSVTSIGPIADGTLANTGGSGLYFSSNPITGAGTIGIAITGVTAGTYGSTGVVPQITVNPQGQITSETDQAITPTSIGMADLTAGTGITAFTYNGSSAQTVTLANTTVTAGTYGDAADVPTYTVNAQGQLTAAANVPISASGIGAVTSVTGNAPIVITGSATAPDVNIQDPGNTPGGVLYSMGTGNSAVYTSSGAVGTILYNNVANTPSWLTPGTAGQILTIVGGIPTWTVAASSAIKDSAWLLTGNSGTTPGTNYIGTNDAEALQFKVDGQKAGWIDYTSPGNTLFGFESGNSSTGDSNTAFGYWALLANTSGGYNAAFGQGALQHNTTGYQNVAIGEDALLYNTTGTNNTAVGTNALFSNTTGYNATASGAFALSRNTTGVNNTAIGVQALQDNTTGSGSIALGYNAGFSNNGDANTFIGDSAGYNNTVGKYNTYIGYASGYSNTSLSNQIYLGDSTGAAAPTAVKFAGALMPYYSANYNAGASGQVLTSQGVGVAPQWLAAAASKSYVKDSAWLLTGNSGTTPGTDFMGTNDNEDVIFKRNGTQSGLLNNASNNTSWGVSALNSATTGTNNTAIGSLSLLVNTSGNYNTANGYSALRANTSGTQNVAMGASALHANTTGNGNTGTGFQVLYNNTSGIENTATGNAALFNNLTGIGNVATGYEAAYSNTTGSSVTALGNYAGDKGTGSWNVYLGDSAGYNNTTGQYNTYIGYESGMSNTSLSNQIYLGDSTGAATPKAVKFAGALMPYYGANYNAGTSGQVLTSEGAGVTPQWLTPSSKSYVKDSAWLLTGNSGTNPTNNWMGTNDAEALQFKVDGQESGWIDYNGNQNAYFGFESGNLPTATGISNAGLGYQALQNNTTGTENVAIGYQALQLNTTGYYNSATGDNALGSNTTGNDNTANGNYALIENTTGSSNTAIGTQTMQGNTTGSYNTANGVATLDINSTGSNNTAFGYQALYSNTNVSNNTAIGYNALTANTTGTPNTSVGYQSLLSNTTGTNNVAVGDNALAANSTGSSNSAFGSGALQANTVGNNTAVGYDALIVNTTGTPNTAVGANSLKANTTGGENTANGCGALSANTTGSQNTAIGLNSLEANTTGLYNTAAGVDALRQNTTGDENTAVGEFALQTNKASENTATGYSALSKNTTGTSVTAVGFQAIYTNSTGSYITAIGNNAGYNNTNSWNVFIGDSAGYNNTTGQYNTYIGHASGKSNTSLSNQIYLGDSTGAAAPTAVKFAGALMPYYSSNYNAGASGQVLTSQGVGATPQWLTPSSKSYVKDSAWLLTGNSGTTPGTNYIGTNDANGFMVKTDNTERAFFTGTSAGIEQFYILAGSAQVNTSPLMEFQTSAGADLMDVNSDDPSDFIIKLF